MLSLNNFTLRRCLLVILTMHIVCICGGPGTTATDTNHPGDVTKDVVDINSILNGAARSSTNHNIESSVNTVELDNNIDRKKKNRNRTRGVRWWNLAQSTHVSYNTVNPTTPLYVNPSLQPLTRKQRRLVTKNPGTIVAIAKGARMAIDECQHQFSNRRWNCPTVDNSHGGSIFGGILKKGCRETAFIYSITSAAVAHSVSQACSEGTVYTCSCGHNSPAAPGHGTHRDWEWGGCSDNIKFGYKFSQDFIDVVERGRDLRFMMNLHNNEAGRTHILKQLKQECKCHGMSGSCTIKTCWLRLHSFRDLGAHLKKRFDGASRVYVGNEGGNRVRERSKKTSKRSTKFNLLPVNPNHKPPSTEDLVYYESSPNFCENTRGRECNATSIGVDGCDLMCCQRGHVTEQYTARERCNCIFHWCCKVTCDICTITRTRHMCL